jgi:hypothetical protein
MDEDRRGRNVSWDDTSHAYGIQTSVFGEDDEATEYRVTFGYRRPLYGNWVFVEIDPGLQWKKDNDFDTAYRIDLGLDALFWGSGYE